MKDPKILQIIQAPSDWHLLRFSLNCPDRTERMDAVLYPVACFALCEEGDERAVLPIAQDDLGQVDLCPATDGYLLDPYDTADDFEPEGMAAIYRVMAVRTARIREHPEEDERLRTPIRLVCGNIRRDVPFTEPAGS